MVTNNSCDYQPIQYNVQTGGPQGQLNNVATAAIPNFLMAKGSTAQPIMTTIPLYTDTTNYSYSGGF